MAKEESFPALSPFLKWAGSKRRLLAQIRPFIPNAYGKYYEPFLGGGSLFFALAPRTAEISDASSALVATYKTVKKDVEKVLAFIEPLVLTRPEFERVKRQKLRAPESRAGAFIFLNKACWNGLYRVNSSGQFNVPYGWPRSNFIVDRDQLQSCSSLLRRKRISIRHQDFEAIESRVSSHDFVFFDPPYVTSHNVNGFVDWNEKLFSWQDQIRLSKLAKRLVEKNVNVIVTNADHPSVIALYRDFEFQRMMRFSTLASDSGKRRTTTEGLFYSGPAYLSRDFQPPGINVPLLPLDLKP